MAGKCKHAAAVLLLVRATGARAGAVVRAGAGAGVGAREGAGAVAGDEAGTAGRKG